MQALFYIGLFGTFFIVMSSITAGVSMSTMQRMVDQRANVAKMFKDVDFAINRIILRETPSLEAYLLGDVAITNLDNVKFTAENVSWSPQQLQTDPWDSDIEVVHIRETAALGNKVEADVNYFILASAGVDREMETQLPDPDGTNLSDINTFAGWRTLRSAGAAGDDIIHTFSTKDALINTWNKSYDVERKITETAQRVYERKVEQFNSSNSRVLDKLTTCAQFGVTNNSGLDGIDCAPYTPDLITKCNQVYNGASTATYVLDAGTSDEAEVDLADVALNDCWRYDPELRDGFSNFPAMAGSMALYSSPNTSGVVEELGILKLKQSDPFSRWESIAFEDEADHPHQLLLQRKNSDNIPGWSLNDRETTIEPK